MEAIKRAFLTILVSNKKVWWLTFIIPAFVGLIPLIFAQNCLLLFIIIANIAFYVLCLILLTLIAFKAVSAWKKHKPNIKTAITYSAVFIVILFVVFHLGRVSSNTVYKAIDTIDVNEKCNY